MTPREPPVSTGRAVGLGLGFLADIVLADPGRWHPVAGFGRLAGRLERGLYADDRGRGAAYTAVLVGAVAVTATALERSARRHPLRQTACTAVATWAVLGGTGLDREGAAVARLLDAGDLPAARRRLTHLVGRETTGLDEGGAVRATVESLAENTSDAVVSPLVLGAVLGVPGLLVHRAVNTLDAMVGHLSPRYARFGWASARLDDLLNIAGARLTAALAALMARTVGGSTREALATWRRDAPGHPSPNAGPVEAAFAGALGVRLGGVNVYHGVAEDRHALGRGRPVHAGDVARARALARHVDVSALAVAVALTLLSGRRPRRGRRRRRRPSAPGRAAPGGGPPRPGA
ncbi:MAG: cobalamin biosynthesis protein, partial [Actinomycetota bacterium]|nr:cobalamin biosynthesis protein [Actinomycetota bacterium]